MFKSFILTLFLVACFMTGLEGYWRSRGFSTTYNDDKVLWATKRKEIYKASDQATVFIGSSRVKFDLDIPTWEKLTGGRSHSACVRSNFSKTRTTSSCRRQKFQGKAYH